MNLQTQIKLNKQPHNQIDYNSDVLLLGSCFSENIGDKFKYFKFRNLVNPFGILFHPIAIENLITRAINNDYYSEDEINFHNEQWSCLDAHSRLNSISKEELLINLNNALEETNRQIKEATHIILTTGTAWVYRNIATDTIVANCHKLPQKQFLKEILSVEQITESLEAIVSLVKTVNPDVTFLFTVSPVRHMKDGFIENTQSKSHIISAIHNLINSRKQLHYFPSYELMIDELRDYRFYNEDMLHPNDLAINYIWEKFITVWLSDDALKTFEDVSSIQSKKAHRPFNINSEAHKKFLNTLELEIEDLQMRYPHISF